MTLTTGADRRNRSRIFVSVGIEGDRSKNSPTTRCRDLLKKLYKAKNPRGAATSHGELFNCLKDRGLPVSDVCTRTTADDDLPSGNIAIRLGRKIEGTLETDRLSG